LKRLYLLRHTKADWSVDVIHDRDRPLAEKGEEDARLVGSFLASLGQIPDEVIASTAVRARETARHVVEGGEWSREIMTSDDLYDAPPWKIFRQVRQQPNELDSLLLVFHEPTCSETLSDLVGHVSVKMPTGALARIDLSVEDWDEVEAGAGTLAWIVTPKILRKA
jgi:phosphohistidine phosphatase